MIDLRIVALTSVGLAAGLVTTARAQVCVQSSPGVAEVDTNGVAVTITVTATNVPKVNGASCGFAAGAIDVVGVAGKDTVTLNYVPPSVPVTMELGAGVNTIKVYATNSYDTIVCDTTTVDRNGDSTPDLDLGSTVVGSVAIYGRGLDDVIDCSAAGYPVKLYGGPGNDALEGGVLDDTLDGGAGVDRIDGGAGNDKLTGGYDNDVVDGGDGNDTLVAQAVFDGYDSFTGGTGTDTIAYSGRTTPLLLGNNSTEDQISDDVETIKGGKGDDILDFSTSALPHNLYGGRGNDTIRGGAGADRLYGETGNDFLLPGGAKDVVIDAGDGDDSLGPTLDGFAETVKCGPGYDSFVASSEDTFKDCETSAVVDPVSHVAAGGFHTCVIATGGVVKCWGANDVGQLGHGDTTSLGRYPGEMGASLPATDLGTGAVAVQLAAGVYHTCALLDDGEVKCWGHNELGQLGYGDTLDRGDEPGEMGDALPAVDLGGQAAIAIAATGDHTCAILDDHAVKCWGDNAYGQLGQGDTFAWGSVPGTMGAALPPIDLGTGRTAVQIDANDYTTCAVLDDGTAKCWGLGGWGQLGQGDGLNRGDGPGEMGDALDPIRVGTGRSVVQIAAGFISTCVLLDDGLTKCFGNASAGQLGNGDAVQSIGDQASEMGDALPALPLGRRTLAVAAGGHRACAVLDDGTAKCWGYNFYGQLGQGDTNDRGDAPGELGAMPAIALGAGRTVAAIALSGSGYHSCAKLDDATLKCWGASYQGELGLEDTLTRGDAPGEMGDALPAVDFDGAVAFAPAPTDEPDAAGGCSATHDAGGALWVVLACLGLRRLQSSHGRSARDGRGVPRRA